MQETTANNYLGMEVQIRTEDGRLVSAKVVGVTPPKEPDSPPTLLVRTAWGTQFIVPGY